MPNHTTGPPVRNLECRRKQSKGERKEERGGEGKRWKGWGDLLWPPGFCGPLLNGLERERERGKGREMKGGEGSGEVAGGLPDDHWRVENLPANVLV